jgi:dTDP-4-dehydrorhamnose reductase
MKLACTGLVPGRISTVLMNYGAEFISCDVRHEEEFREAVQESDPDVLIHTAALTSVDFCETYPKDAYDVNIMGMWALVDFWKKPVIFLSTDHVFDGKKWFGSGYKETHSPSPLNVYGMSKLAAEALIESRNNFRIIRTSKVFDLRDLEMGLKTLLESDEFLERTALIKRSFVYVNHFVNGLVDAASKFAYLPEILNISGTEIYSHATFWKMICRVFDVDEQRIDVRNKELKNLAPRPLRCGLNISRARGLEIPLYSGLDGIKEIKELYG